MAFILIFSTTICAKMDCDGNETSLCDNKEEEEEAHTDFDK